MSIIEQALIKSRAEKLAQSGARAESRTENPTVRKVPPGRVEGASAAPETPARSITLDPKALLEHGLQPPEDYVARLREDYRRIKWPLLDVALKRTAAPVERGNLIMVASSLANEGKTFTAFNLAVSIAAERDCSVLLIDGDIAKPRLTRVLGLEKERGLVELLTDANLALRDVVLGTNVPGLRVLPAGAAHASGPELLGGHKMERVVAELAAWPAGHVVLFDSPPLLAANEAQVLSRFVGQVVMVVRADETPRTAVRDAIELISRSASVGLVLNQNKMSFGAQYYGEYGYPRS